MLSAVLHYPTPRPLPPVRVLHVFMSSLLLLLPVLNLFAVNSGCIDIDLDFDPMKT